MDPKELSQVVKVGKCLSNEVVQKLAGLLSENRDVFAWTHANMVGIHVEILYHRLNMTHRLNQCTKSEKR